MGAHRRMAGLLGVALGAVALLAAAPAGAKVTGDPEAIALARQIDAAYANAPGIRISGRLTVKGRAPLAVEYLYALRNSRVTVARIRLGSQAAGLLAVDNLRGSSEFDPGRSCWTRTGPSEAVGSLPMTDPGDRFLPPKARGTTIEFTEITRDGSQAVHLISATTLRFISTKVTLPGGARLTLGYTVLTRTPTIPAPTPRC